MVAADVRRSQFTIFDLRFTSVRTRIALVNLANLSGGKNTNLLLLHYGFETFASGTVIPQERKWRRRSVTGRS
jgi:hypothetical protein